MNIEASGIAKSYGKSTALREVSLRVPGSARVVVLVGPSGGGKSTLLRLIGDWKHRTPVRWSLMARRFPEITPVSCGTAGHTDFYFKLSIFSHTSRRCRM
ncbi:MAG: hypothetical protein R3F31_08350 [Verrucomicrobiales bacterium]